MTHRERVLKTFRFEKTDHPPYDLMESTVWPELAAYFADKHELTTNEDIFNFLDVDFRWLFMSYTGPVPEAAPPVSDASYPIDNPPNAPLRNAHTVAEVEAYIEANGDFWQAPDCKAAREKWPDHAIVACPGWLALFWSACTVFGMEEALIKMETEPDVFEAYVRKRHKLCMELISRTVDSAAGYADIVYLGDDYASNDATIMHPDTWRKLIKPYVAEEVKLIRDAGMYAIMHSCGAVSEILPDFTEIGINSHLVFQTSAKGMEPERIAKDFGGEIVFYGGIDCQHLLTWGTPDDVRAEVRRNREAFRDCGGYIVSNSHHCISNIKPENMMAMFEEAREVY